MPLCHALDWWVLSSLGESEGVCVGIALSEFQLMESDGSYGLGAGAWRLWIGSVQPVAAAPATWSFNVV